MSSLSDILTAAKNVVTAINGVAQTYLAVNGALSTEGVAATAVVQPGPGRVATVSVTTAGSTVGHVYDASATTDTSRPLYVIPMTVGVVFVNMPVSYGIVIAPGTGQVVAVSYS